MSTKAAESEQYGDSREWVTCDICGGRFVSHKYYERRIKYPDKVCIWCFSRGYGKKEGLYYRWETMSRAVKAIAKVGCQKEEPVEGCKCLTCFARLTLEKVFPDEYARPRPEASSQVPLPDDARVAVPDSTNNHLVEEQHPMGSVHEPVR